MKKFMKKALSLMLAAMMIIAMAPVSANAATGSGTEFDPYVLEEGTTVDVNLAYYKIALETGDTVKFEHVGGVDAMLNYGVAGPGGNISSYMPFDNDMGYLTEAQTYTATSDGDFYFNIVADSWTENTQVKITVETPLQGSGTEFDPYVLEEGMTVDVNLAYYKIALETGDTVKFEHVGGVDAMLNYGVAGPGGNISSYMPFDNDMGYLTEAQTYTATSDGDFYFNIVADSWTENTQVKITVESPLQGSGTEFDPYVLKEGMTVDVNLAYYKIALCTGDTVKFEHVGGVDAMLNYGVAGPGGNISSYMPFDDDMGYLTEAQTYTATGVGDFYFNIVADSWTENTQVKITVTSTGSGSTGGDSATVPTSGTSGNPDTLTFNTPIEAVTYADPDNNGYDQHFYSFTPAVDIKLTITMDTTVNQAYMYGITGGAWSTDYVNAGPDGGAVYVSTTTGETPSSYYYVKAEETVTVWVATNPMGAGTVTFTATLVEEAYPTSDAPVSPFTDTKDETDKTYIVAKEEYNLKEGDNVDLPVSTEYASTIYEFAPGKSGVYKFEVVGGGKIGYWGGNVQYMTNPNATTATIEKTFKVDTDTAAIGVTGVGADKCTIKVTRLGDVEVKEVEEKDYTNKVKPQKFTLAGSEDDYEYIFTDAGNEVNKAVLGEDGFYHLNSVNGAIIYVDLDDTAMIDVNKEKLEAYTFDEDDDLIQIMDYTAAFAEYVACADSKTGYYPLTADLMELYQKVGESQHWYSAKDGEDAWMFSCATSRVLEGEDGKWTQNGKEGFVIHLKYDYTEFKELKIDGKVVDKKYYTAEEGSIIITLKPEYLNTLEVGKHTVSVVLSNGEVETSLTVVASETSEIQNKGDNTALYVTFLLVGCAAVVAAVATKKKFA